MSGILTIWKTTVKRPSSLLRMLRIYDLNASNLCFECVSSRFGCFVSTIWMLWIFASDTSYIPQTYTSETSDLCFGRFRFTLWILKQCALVISDLLFRTMLQTCFGCPASRIFMLQIYELDNFDTSFGHSGLALSMLWSSATYAYDMLWMLHFTF